jgi:poly(3-hydroxybutyrate) depolymerase
MFRSKKRAILTVVATALVALIAAVAAFLYFSGLGALLWFVINLEGETPQPEFAQRLAESGLVVHTVGGSRPATLALPAGHDPQTPIPLFLALHGYSGFASMMDDFFRIPSRVNAKGFALILADGTPDDDGNRFWNATGLCCGRTETKPDDVAYLSGLVEEAKTLATIDRTYLIG